MAWPGVIEHYRERLPLPPGAKAVTLLEGNTPLVETPRLAAALGKAVGSAKEFRYYGAYANRSRAICRPATGEGTAGRPVAAHGSEPKPSSRASWARLIRRVCECDPLTGPRCGAEMKIVSFLTEPAVIDRIVRHLEDHPREDPFDARAPPAA